MVKKSKTRFDSKKFFELSNFEIFYLRVFELQIFKFSTAYMGVGVPWIRLPITYKHQTSQPASHPYTHTSHYTHIPTATPTPIYTPSPKIESRKFQNWRIRNKSSSSTCMEDTGFKKLDPAHI
jgi:hypothetical protein